MNSRSATSKIVLKFSESEKLNFAHFGPKGTKDVNRAYKPSKYVVYLLQGHNISPYQIGFRGSLVVKWSGTGIYMVQVTGVYIIDHRIYRVSADGVTVQQTHMGLYDTTMTSEAVASRKRVLNTIP